MKILGIDPSLNSTGICLVEDGKAPKYFLIVSTNKYKSKKTQDFISGFKHKRLSVFLYNTQEPLTNSYSDKETAKTYNIISIKNALQNIIKKCKPDAAIMEGVSYGSSGAVADLAGLNYLFRSILYDCSVPLTVVSPNENKKNATGNGAANKEEMIYAWHQCDVIYKDIDKCIKTDDLADAYFLANFNNK